MKRNSNLTSTQNKERRSFLHQSYCKAVPPKSAQQKIRNNSMVAMNMVENIEQCISNG